MRYLCFGYDTYYPRGGMRDCRLITEDFEKAKNWLYVQQNHYDYSYIYDLEDSQEIYIQDLESQMTEVITPYL